MDCTCPLVIILIIDNIYVAVLKFKCDTPVFAYIYCPQTLSITFQGMQAKALQVTDLFSLPDFPYVGDNPISSGQAIYLFIGCPIYPYPLATYNVKMSPIRPQLCFSATWGTVKPLDKSAFIRFGSVAIFNKWLRT